MAALHTDENVPFELVQHLRDLGHDVLTALEAGRANARIPDPDVLSFATGEGRAVVTGNRGHFRRLHQLHPDHEGIITFTEDSDFAALAQRIHDAIAPLDTLKGQLIRIIRPNPSSQP